MRTTVTLDPDAEALIRQAMVDQKKTFKQVLNEAICCGLKSSFSAQTRMRYQVRAFWSDYLPGVDRLRLQQIADEFETDSYLTSAMQR